MSPCCRGQTSHLGLWIIVFCILQPWRPTAPTSGELLLGFVDGRAGLPQAAHYAEHFAKLACRARKADAAAKEADTAKEPKPLKKKRGGRT